MTPIQKAQLLLFVLGAWMLVVSLLLIAVLNQYRRTMKRVNKLDADLAKHMADDSTHWYRTEPDE